MKNVTIQFSKMQSILSTNTRLAEFVYMHRKPRMQLEEIINLKPALLSAAAEPLTSSLKGGLSHYHLAPSLTKTV